MVLFLDMVSEMIGWRSRENKAIKLWQFEEVLGFHLVSRTKVCLLRQSACYLALKLAVFFFSFFFDSILQVHGVMAPAHLCFLNRSNKKYTCSGSSTGEHRHQNSRKPPTQRKEERKLQSCDFCVMDQCDIIMCARLYSLARRRRK